MRELIVLLGIPVDNLSMDEALNALEELVRDGRARSQGHQAVTVNVDFIVNALHDPDLLSILREASLATADGMPLVWAARLLGAPLKERVAGADLVPALAERAAQKGYSLYLFGGAPGIAAQAGAILQERYPGLEIAGAISPPFQPGLETDPAILDDIRASCPDILLVALGNPKQEKWIRKYAPVLGVPLMMGVGGSLDFISGNTKRAPVWMQRKGLEWVWRLSHEPRRLWRRYVVGLGVFGFYFLRQGWAMRRRKTPLLTLPSANLILMEGISILNIQGRMTVDELPHFKIVESQALAWSSRLVVDLSRAEFLDSSAIGALVGLVKLAHAAGGELVLASTPPNIHSTLTMLRLNTFFLMCRDLDSALSVLTALKLAVRSSRELVPVE